MSDRAWSREKEEGWKCLCVGEGLFWQWVSGYGGLWQRNSMAPLSLSQWTRIQVLGFYLVQYLEVISWLQTLSMVHDRMNTDSSISVPQNFKNSHQWKTIWRHSREKVSFREAAVIFTMRAFCTCVILIENKGSTLIVVLKQVHQIRGGEIIGAYCLLEHVVGCDHHLLQWCEYV